MCAPAAGRRCEKEENALSGWIFLGVFLVMCCVGLTLLYLALVEAEKTGRGRNSE